MVKEDLDGHEAAAGSSDITQMRWNRFAVENIALKSK